MTFAADAQRYAKPGEFGYLAADSGILVISFAGLDGRPPFQFYGTLQALGCNALFLSDRAKNWYNTGLPCLGPTLDHTLYVLRHLTSYFDPERVLLIGGSMGGYGALLYASLLGKGRVLAFSPQVVLKRHYGWHPERDEDLHFPDLSQLAYDGNALTVIASTAPLDVLSLSKIARVPCQRGVFLAVDQEHNIAKVLKQKGVLAEFLRHWIGHGEVPYLDPVEKGLVAGPHLDALEALLDAVLRGQWQDALRPAHLFSLRTGNSCHLDYHVGSVYFYNGQFEDSLRFIESALAKSPSYAGAHVHYVANLAVFGLWDRALRHYDDCVWLRTPQARSKSAFLLACASALGKVRKRRAAIRLREHVLDLDDEPSLRRANFFQLGRLYHAIGALKKSRAAFDRVLQEEIQDWMHDRTVAVYLPALRNADLHERE